MNNVNFSTPSCQGPRAPTFETERLQFAVFLHATERLPFSQCEMAGKGKVRFVFEDPENIGDQTELDFERGAEVPATALFASQKFLRRKMSQILRNIRCVLNWRL